MSDTKSESTAGIEGQGSMVSRQSGASSAPSMEPEEDSGLHDLRELAQSAKMRISNNMRAANEANEVFLASSSLALRAVALPDPSKSLNTMAAVTTAAAPAPASSQAAMPAWLYAVLGAVAAGAVVFVLLRGGQGSSASSQPAASPSAGTVVTPVVVPAWSGGAGAPGAALGATKEAGSPVDPSAASQAAALGTSGEGAPGQSAASSADSAGKARSAGESQSAARTATKPADKQAGEAGSDSTKAAEPAESKTAETAAAEAKKPADKPVDALDALLAEAAAGGDKSGSTSSGGQPARPSEPARTSLDGSDVKKAMAPILAKTRACYDKYQVPGLVTVRFSVAPSGEVISAAAQGEFKGTDTGTCVADLVRTASFPPFSGAQMSFSYPFLLSQ